MTGKTGVKTDMMPTHSKRLSLLSRFTIIKNPESEGETGPERWSDKFRVTQQTSGNVRTRTQVSGAPLTAHQLLKLPRKLITMFLRSAIATYLRVGCVYREAGLYPSSLWFLNCPR